MVTVRPKAEEGDQHHVQDGPIRDVKRRIRLTIPLIDQQAHLHLKDLVPAL
jgi:TolB-like protein